MKSSILRAAAAVIAGAMLCTAVGCGGPARRRNGKNPREKHNYPDGSLVGTWTNYEYTASVTEQGSVSIHRDLSEFMYYLMDGTLLLDGIEIAPEGSRLENDTLTITGKYPDIDDETLLVLSRKGDTSSPMPEQFDGVYEITGGALEDQVKSEYAAGYTGPVGVEFDKGNCDLVLMDYCNIVQKGDEVTLSGDSLAEAGYTPEVLADLYFVLEDDKAVFHFNSGNTETFSKLG